MTKLAPLPAFDPRSMTSAEIAEFLNSWLREDPSHRVQIETYTKATLYLPRHAGRFYAAGNELRERRGRGSLCLKTASGQLLVSIRIGRVVAR